MYIAIAVVVLVFVFLMMKRGGDSGAATYEDLSTEKVHEIVGDSSYQLVDVREPNEFSSGHIEGAENIPLGTISSSLDKLDKDKKIVFICRSGNRSSKAAKMVGAEEGYEVYNMKGGMLAWKYEVK